jgi:hypothetical protein
MDIGAAALGAPGFHRRAKQAAKWFAARIFEH